MGKIWLKSLIHGNPKNRSYLSSPMKTNKILVGLFSVLIPFISIPAKAQNNRPDFCKIHAGNVSQYTSQYNMFSQSANTPFRPFISNSATYNVNKQLIAKPLYYVAISDGSVGVAFQLAGRLGNQTIGKKDVVVQHIKHYPVSGYTQVVGYCVNGVFLPNQKTETYRTMDLPLNTQGALQEAALGIQQEQVGRMFK